MPTPSRPQAHRPTRGGTVVGYEQGPQRFNAANAAARLHEVDVRLPPTHTTEGLEGASAARRARPDLPILVLSQWVKPLYARDLLSSGDGAIGYLLKDRVADIDSFIAALRQVAAGGPCSTPRWSPRW